MVINFVANWRMNLFLSILFISAFQSCSLEKAKLYEAWWLEHQNLLFTSRQIVRKEIRLPDWYLRLYSIIFALGNLAKIPKEIIISSVSLILLVSGALCLSLGSWLIDQQQNKGCTNSTQDWFWCTTLKGNSKIVKIAVAVSSLPCAVTEYVHESSLKASLHICVPVGNRVAIMVPAEAMTKGQAKTQDVCSRQPQSHIDKASKRNAKVCQNKNTIGYPAAIEKQMKKLYQTLSEKDKRRYAGVEALKLERGGIVYIASVLACDRKTVSKGIEELKNLSRRHVDQQRTRRRGAGRKPYHMTHEHIDEQFLDVLKEHTAGDPMREAVKWTNLTPQEICQLLEQKYNTRISKTVVCQILDKHNYHRRKILKKKTMKEVAYRNQQFETIATYKASYLNSPNPIISMDNKKKEYLGNFYRNGYLYTQRALHCYDHDFPSFAEGIIIPHGIYDIKQNKGYIHLGTSHETSEFSCECLKEWWFKHGRYDYPDASAILILCDGGGSNSSRHYIFKQDLQKLVNEIGIAIRIAHYPPYCSKWNPIEHRLFPHVTRACQGVLFENIGIVQSLMQKTKTRQGLEVEVEILDKVYQTGRKATDDFRQNMGISFDESLPTLNYTVVPSGEVI